MKTPSTIDSDLRMTFFPVSFPSISRRCFVLRASRSLLQNYNDVAVPYRVENRREVHFGAVCSAGFLLVDTFRYDFLKSLKLHFKLLIGVLAKLSKINYEQKDCSSAPLRGLFAERWRALVRGGFVASKN